MANMITESVTLSIKGTSVSASQTGSITVAQVGSNYIQETQLVTSAAAVKLDVNPDIVDGNLGYLMVRNTSAIVAGVASADATYIDIATDALMTNKIARIQPNRGAYIPPPGGTVNLWAQANGADVQIVFLAIEL